MVQEIDFISAETSKRNFTATLDAFTSPCVGATPGPFVPHSTPVTRTPRTRIKSEGKQSARSVG
ncbi:hypothetical protein DPMN_040402 [Dreissena polymorpha]|uniref:Uncharacterized protein n=1 Tax=Dreissena polymorpha TaxID=45954 RepID=A0A9D4CUZ0_DREPO|nr:hypothetical protein DPMN_040402 [Dreissena polymorpha]